MKEDLLANASKVYEEDKPLTLKSLEKQINEKLTVLDTKISKIERNIEVLKKVARR